MERGRVEDGLSAAAGCRCVDGEGIPGLAFTSGLPGCWSLHQMTSPQCCAYVEIIGDLQ